MGEALWCARGVARRRGERRFGCGFGGVGLDRCLRCVGQCMGRLDDEENSHGNESWDSWIKGIVIGITGFTILGCHIVRESSGL